MKVTVQNDNIEQAIQKLRKKLTKDGFFAELREREYALKPSEKKKRKEAKAEKRRRRKNARRKMNHARKRKVIKRNVQSHGADQRASDNGSAAGHSGPSRKDTEGAGGKQPQGKPEKLIRMHKGSVLKKGKRHERPSRAEKKAKVGSPAEKDQAS